MKSLKVISAIELVLMVCSTIINILGYTDKISMSYVRISFLIVILCGMIILIKRYKSISRKNRLIFKLIYR